MNPLFSIVVPVYNSEIYLKDCVSSVLKQSVDRFELILVDDGSTDSSGILCDNYQKIDSRVRVVHKENGGHTSARCMGMKNSTGDYIIFLDSDDQLSAHALEVFEEEIAAHAPDIIVIDEYIAENGVHIIPEIGSGYYDLSQHKRTIMEALIMRSDGTFVIPKCLSGKAFRRSCIYDAQLSVPEDVLMGEDGAAFIKAALSAQSLSVNLNASYIVHQRDTSVSRTGDSLACRRLVSLAHFYQTLPQINEDASIGEQVNRLIVWQLYTAVKFLIYAGCDNMYIKEEIDAALAEETIGRAFVDSARSTAGRLRLKRHLLKRKWIEIIKRLIVKSN